MTEVAEEEEEEEKKTKKKKKLSLPMYEERMSENRGKSVSVRE